MRPDFRIYKWDTTEYWDESIRAKAGQIFAVYIFDSTWRIHACEFTPSYEMTLLGSTWTADIEDDSERQDLCEDIRKADADDEKFAYIHCKDVNLTECEAMGPTEEEWLTLLAGWEGDEDAAYEAALEGYVEFAETNGYTY
jgi:hypothetical protein